MTAAPRGTGRLGERSEASIEALVQVARATFGEHGYARTSLEDVAAASGMTKGAVYHLVTIHDAVARRILLQDGPSVLGWGRWRRCEEPGFQQMMETSLRAAAGAGMLREGLHPADTAVLLRGAVTEGGLAIAHAAEALRYAAREEARPSRPVAARVLLLAASETALSTRRRGGAEQRRDDHAHRRSRGTASCCS